MKWRKDIYGSEVRYSSIPNSPERPAINFVSYEIGRKGRIIGESYPAITVKFNSEPAENKIKDIVTKLNAALEEDKTAKIQDICYKLGVVLEEDKTAKIHITKLGTRDDCYSRQGEKVKAHEYLDILKNAGFNEIMSQDLELLLYIDLFLPIPAYATEEFISNKGLDKINLPFLIEEPPVDVVGQEFSSSMDA